MRPLPLIYLTRHGQTDWNAEERFQGQRDIPLNETGRAQARANGETLRGLLGAAEGFDFVSSPLGRTRETMEIVRAAMGLDPHAYRTDERLKELSFGAWEGLTMPEIEARTARDVQDAREADKWNFRPPGERAESYADLAGRIEGWLSGVREPTVAVIHGGVVRTLFHLIGGLNETDAAHADTPQDRVLRIEGNMIGWL